MTLRRQHRLQNWEEHCCKRVCKRAHQHSSVVLDEIKTTQAQGNYHPNIEAEWSKPLHLSFAAPGHTQSLSLTEERAKRAERQITSEEQTPPLGCTNSLLRPQRQRRSGTTWGEPNTWERVKQLCQEEWAEIPPEHVQVWPTDTGSTWLRSLLPQRTQTVNSVSNSKSLLTLPTSKRFLWPFSTNDIISTSE